MKNYPNVGDLYVSETEGVLIRVLKIDKKKDLITNQLADSDFHLEGPLSNWEGLKKRANLKKITQEQWDVRLLTYKEEMFKKNQQHLEEVRRTSKNYEKVLAYYVLDKSQPVPVVTLPFKVPVLLEFEESNCVGFAHTFYSTEDGSVYCDISVPPEFCLKIDKMIPSLGISLDNKEEADAQLIAHIHCVGLVMVNEHLPELKSVSTYKV